METFLLLSAVIGAIANIITTVTTNQQNLQNAENMLENQQTFSHEEAELANQRQLQNYWETMSPESRVKQLKDAGLSVGLMYGGNTAGGGVNTGTQAQTPGANLPIMQNPLQNLSEMFENIRTTKEAELLGTEKDKATEEIQKIKSDIELNDATITQIATENNLTKVLTSNADLDNIMKQIEIEVSENTKRSRIEIVSQQLENLRTENNKMLEEITGLEIDNSKKEDLYNATINKTAAETALLWKQVIKTEQETLLTNATRALTEENAKLSFAERQKTWKEIKNLKSLNAKIDAEIKLLEQQTGKTKLQKTSEVINWITTASNITGEIGKYATIAAGAIIK